MRQGLLPLDAIKNKHADEPWKKSERDRMLDLWLRGMLPARIAIKLGRNPKAVERHIEEYLYNQRDKVLKYLPRKRRWRGGQPLTETEKNVIRAHQKREIPTEATARLLQRKPNEIRRDVKGEIKINRFKEIAPTCDILLAHRYLYYVAHHPVISDQAYDTAKYEEIEFGGGVILLQPASDKVVDYPPHIRSLAHYLQFKDMDYQGKVDFDKLPMYFAPDGHWKRKADETKERERRKK